MTIERSFAMIKPDAVENRLVGRILMRIEDEHFRIAEMQQVRLAPSQAAAFYAEHKGQPFFDKLVEFMSSGPLVAMVLERGHGWRHAEGVVKHWREVMGATDSRRAAFDTIRQRHGDKTGLAIYKNCVHGSDSTEAAAREIAFFWPDLVPRGTPVAMDLDTLHRVELVETLTALVSSPVDGPRLRKARKALGLTREELATTLGYTVKDIEAVETGFDAAGRWSSAIPPVYVAALRGLLREEIESLTTGSAALTTLKIDAPVGAAVPVGLLDHLLTPQYQKQTCSRCGQWFVNGHGASVIGPCTPGGEHDWQIASVEPHVFCRVEGQVRDIAEAHGFKAPDEKAHIYQAMLEGRPLAEPGNRANAVNFATAMLAHNVPLTMPWSEAERFIRPSILAMDCEPEGLEHWLDVAKTVYERAQERRTAAKE